MDLVALHALAAVVREGSFTAAARALGVSKQTVSDRVAALEHEVGVRLLSRTTRRVTPTAAGATYVARVAALLAGLDEAGRDLQAAQREPTGVLRVSAPVLYGRRFLPEVVAAYMTRHPAVRCEVALSDGYVNLYDEGFDVVIRVGAVRDTTLTARRLGSARVRCVASPSFLAAHGAPARAADLARARCIVVRAGETWEVDGATVRVAPALVVNDLELACDAAVRGVGIARLPSFLCDAPIRAGALRALFDDGEGNERPVWALYAGGTHAPAKVRRFIDALREAPGMHSAPRARSSDAGASRRGDG